MEQGSFESLRNAGGYVQSLAARVKSEDTITPAEKNPDASAKPVLFKPDDEEEIEELNRQTGDFAVYKYYFSSIGWVASILFFAFILLYGVASKMTEFLLTFWTSAVDAHGNEVNNFYLGLYAMLSLLGLLGIVFGILQLALIMMPKSAEFFTNIWSLQWCLPR